MDVGTISRRYAIALYKYACKHKVEKHIYEETIALSKSYMQYPALRRTVDNPILPKEKKEKLLCLAAGGKISAEFIVFLRLIVSQKREMFLQIICYGYQAIYRHEKKLVHMYIITAVNIDKNLKAQIAEKFQRYMHEKIAIETIIDAGIIGGYIVRWDTYRWDVSIATRLKQIKEELTDTVKID